MYFPYFYGRQSEFLALRGMLADHRALNNFLPIIEPVNADASGLRRCIAAFTAAQQRIAVVVNPDKHELQGAAQQAWLQAIIPEIQQSQFVVPVFFCSPQVSFLDINQFIAYFAGRKVALVYSSVHLTDAEIKALAANASVDFHVVLDGRMSAAQQAFLPLNKRVDIRDCFNKLSRNADYGVAEFFTDRHVSLAGWAGFGDYATIGSEFNPGGGPAAAVAIHAIFKDASGDIWVEHFVSDDTDIRIGDTASKFLQASRKLVNAANARPHEFGNNFALDAYRNNLAANHFPGLPTNKVQQVEHHICLMLDVLSGAV